MSVPVGAVDHGDDHARHGDPEDVRRRGAARDAWAEAVEVDPRHVFARYALAMYELQARKQGGFLFGSYKKAKKHAEALLEIGDAEGPFWGHVALGQVSAAQEEWDEMTKHFDSAESSAPRDDLRSMALFMHASALVNDKKDAKAAMPVVERCLASGPENQTTAYYLRGSVRKELGDCPAAMLDFRHVLSLNEDAQNTRFFLAQCCESTGDTAGAVLHYEEYLKRFPKGQRAADATKALKRLKRA